MHFLETSSTVIKIDLASLKKKGSDLFKNSHLEIYLKEQYTNCVLLCNFPHNFCTKLIKQTMCDIIPLKANAY